MSDVLHKHIQKFDTTNDPVITDDRIHEMTMQIINERNAIIDLFCKTFLSVQEAPNAEALKDLFKLIELECTMHSDCKQTFRIKLREDEQKS